MNDVTTFFRDRQKDAGETYQLTLEGWRGTHHVSVYSQRSIPSQTLQDKNVATQQDYETAVKDLRKAMTAGGGGGLIVIANDEKRSRTFSVLRVNAKSAAQGFFALSPGRPAAFVRVDGNGGDYKLAEGSHALVPVSEEAQERLQDFVGSLSWLSPDIESLVVNAIRRPSLDRRLDRVETHLFARTTDDEIASAQQGVIGRISSWMVRSVPQPLTRLSTAIMLVLLLAMNGAVLLHLDSQNHTSLFAPIRRAILRPKKADVEPVVRDAKTLLGAINESEDSSVRKVNRAHFTGITTDEQISKAMQRPDVLWGLVKLQMLAIDSRQQVKDVLSEKTDYLRITSAYATIPAQEFSNDARHFLAAVACRMHDTQLPFSPDDCSTVPSDAFEKGLQRLTTFVNPPQPTTNSPRNPS